VVEMEGKGQNTKKNVGSPAYCTWQLIDLEVYSQ
jgi:hypothetical protein